MIGEGRRREAMEEGGSLGYALAEGNWTGGFGMADKVGFGMAWGSRCSVARIAKQKNCLKSS